MLKNSIVFRFILFLSVVTAKYPFNQTHATNSTIPNFIICPMGKTPTVTNHYITCNYDYSFLLKLFSTLALCGIFQLIIYLLDNNIITI
ncbi:hypothetical protein BC833DRAFT_576034 [Globomyces pollinis-pini]|nr:hypothetical protein BC833DRAFT_576034 [Globomyces pollinis-pini]